MRKSILTIGKWLLQTLVMIIMMFIIMFIVVKMKDRSDERGLTLRAASIKDTPITNYNNVDPYIGPVVFAEDYEINKMIYLEYRMTRNFVEAGKIAGSILQSPVLTDEQRLEMTFAKFDCDLNVSLQEMQQAGSHIRAKYKDQILDSVNTILDYSSKNEKLMGMVQSNAYFKRLYEIAVMYKQQENQ